MRTSILHILSQIIFFFTDTNAVHLSSLERTHLHLHKIRLLMACLQGGGEPHVGEVTYGGSPHLTCKRDIKYTGGLPHLI